jgi:hypothetical protein
MDDDLGIAWLVQRYVVSQMLAGKEPPDLPMVDAVIVEALNRGREVWNSMAPAAVAKKGLDEELAFEYAKQLGDGLDEVSTNALKEGYTASLSTGVDRSLSWARVTKAWGLDGAQMRSYIGTMPTDGYQKQAVPEKQLVILETMLNTRADRMKANEEWSIQELAKQIQWIKMVKTGEIGEESKKRWHTALDERVCPTCGPLHERTVYTYETFDRGVFAPPVHVNCRCWVELDPVEVITKAVPAAYETEREYRRDLHGRFSRVDTLQGSKPKVYKRPQLQTSGGGAGIIRTPNPLISLNEDEIPRMLRRVDGRVYYGKGSVYDKNGDIGQFTTLDEFVRAIAQKGTAGVVIPYDYSPIILSQQEANETVMDKTVEVFEIIRDAKQRAGKEFTEALPRSVRMEVDAGGVKKGASIKTTPFQKNSNDLYFTVLPEEFRSLNKIGSEIDLSQSDVYGFESGHYDFNTMGWDKRAIADAGEIDVIVGPMVHEDIFNPNSGLISGKYVLMNDSTAMGEFAAQLGVPHGTVIKYWFHPDLMDKGVGIGLGRGDSHLYDDDDEFRQDDNFSASYDDD